MENKEVIVLLGVPDGRLIDALNMCRHEHVERMRRLLGFDYDLIEPVQPEVRVMSAVATDVAAPPWNGPGAPTRRGGGCRGRATRWLITPQIEWSQAPPAPTDVLK